MFKHFQISVIKVTHFVPFEFPTNKPTMLIKIILMNSIKAISHKINSFLILLKEINCSVTRVVSPRVKAVHCSEEEIIVLYEHDVQKFQIGWVLWEHILTLVKTIVEGLFFYVKILLLMGITQRTVNIGTISYHVFHPCFHICEVGFKFWVVEFQKLVKKGVTKISLDFIYYYKIFGKFSKSSPAILHCMCSTNSLTHQHILKPHKEIS